MKSVQAFFELSLAQVKTYAGSATDIKPLYPRLLSGDINTFTYQGLPDLAGNFNRKKH